MFLLCFSFLKNVFNSLAGFPKLSEDLTRLGTPKPPFYGELFKFSFAK